MNKNMNNRKNFLRITFVIVILIITIGAYGYYHFFCVINAIKPGEKITESISPNGDYTVTAN